jgi:hypothetical protein
MGVVPAQDPGPGKASYSQAYERQWTQT